MKVVISIYLLSFVCFSLEASQAFYNRKARQQLLSAIDKSSGNGELFTDFGNLDESTGSGVTSTLSVDTSSTNVDFSSSAVSHRLQIYIKGSDAGALFSELAGNPAAATLKMFEGLLPALTNILSSFEEESSSVNLVASVINAFIHFNVDVTRAANFRKPQIKNLFVNKLKTHSSPILAYFILFQDYQLIEGFANSLLPINFYAVENAIMMLSSQEKQLKTINLLYKTFGAEAMNRQKFPRRLIRDSPDVDLCMLLQEKGFDPTSSRRPLYLKCRLARNHPKWEYFASIYGQKVIEEHLESGNYILPQKSSNLSNQPRLPFHVYPVKDLNNRRLNLYKLAYGEDSFMALNALS